MADFFLSNLKSTLDNCITELDEIHSMFCRNPESDFVSLILYMYICSFLFPPEFLLKSCLKILKEGGERQHLLTPSSNL